MQTLYQILGVTEDAAVEDIRHAYRRLVRQFHPDVSGGDTSRPLRQIIEAYGTLSDERKRRTYDDELARRRRLLHSSPAVRRPRWRSTPLADHREWFSDEIDIDFPSIADLVERIRDSFFAGDEEGALSAEIELSWREAFDGVTVPLEVPVRRTCPLCGGRGESWMEPCHGCGGTGTWPLPHSVRVSVPPGVSDGARFRFTVTVPHTPPTLVEVRVAIR